MTFGELIKGFNELAPAKIEIPINLIINDIEQNVFDNEILLNVNQYATCDLTNGNLLDLKSRAEHTTFKIDIDILKRFKLLYNSAIIFAKDIEDNVLKFNLLNDSCKLKELNELKSLDELDELNQFYRQYDYDDHNINKTIKLTLINDSNIIKIKIFINDEPELIKHLLLKVKYNDYVFPLQMKEILTKKCGEYDVSKNIYNLLSEKNNVISDKAQWYLDKYKNINLAFEYADYEDKYTLMSIYKQGVDINFDIGHSINMFNWSISANKCCNPYFLELLFKFERKDICEYGQKVFEMACGYATVEHIKIFLENSDKIDNFDLWKGIRCAIHHDNMENLHYLLLFYNKELNHNEIWKEMNSIFSNCKRVLKYFSIFYNFKITKERLIESLRDKFYDDFKITLDYYLIQQNGETFKITKDVIDQSLKTNDRISKFKLLKTCGFEVENLDELIRLENENLLPEPSIKRYRQIM
jgi:hypothetical protein